MTVTTNEFGQQNMFAKEPQMYVSRQMPSVMGMTYAERAEKLNGRTAMLGFAAALISYTFGGGVFFFTLRILITMPDLIELLTYYVIVAVVFIGAPGVFFFIVFMPLQIRRVVW